LDNETGKVKWVDASRGLAKDPKGDPTAPEGRSPVASTSQKVPPLGKQ
jgi:hypothetical protein